MSADLAPAIRAALLAEPDVVSILPAYLSSFPIFTRRPVPESAPYPMIVVSSDVSVMDEDGVADLRPIVVKDVAIYGLNDTPEHYRAVESLAQIVRTLFHRRKPFTSVGVWSIIDFVASGPRVAPVEAIASAGGSEPLTGRVVSLTIRLSEL